MFEVLASNELKFPSSPNPSNSDGSTSDRPHRLCFKLLQRYGGKVLHLKHPVFVMAGFGPKTRQLSPLEMIISCAVCQKPYTEIYDTKDNNRGLRQGSDPQDGRIPKLWLTECAHLTCGKHLEGGGTSTRGEATLHCSILATSSFVAISTEIHHQKKRT